jgi:glutamate 5-kinase
VDENASLIPLVEKIDQNILSSAGGANDPLATGGMRTKIDAAEKATSRGIDTIVINGKKSQNFEKLLKGVVLGTLFKKTVNPLAAKKHWMLYAMNYTGKIIVDEGAEKALRKKGASLLPSGILNVEGNFLHGDAVEVMTIHDGVQNVIARGITQYSAQNLRKIKGKKSDMIENILGYAYTDVVIQRDDLVIVN